MQLDILMVIAEIAVALAGFLRLHQTSQGIGRQKRAPC